MKRPKRFIRFLLAAFAAVLVLCATAFAQPPALPEGKLPLVERAWSADGDKFSFAILGDKTSGGEGKWPIFDRAVDAINLLDPDFVITVGDQIPGHMQDRAAWDEEWAEYMAHAKRLDAPFFLVPGNHDIANVECYAFWEEDFGRTYYSFDYKGCHFLVLNTEEERFDGRGPVWERMMLFAADDLKRSADSRHTFLFFHKPMWDDPRYLDDWQRIEDMLADRPFTVVAGHEHYLMSERRNGNLYVIQSATGGGIHLSDVREFGCFHSFAHVTVDDGDTHYAVVEPEGGVWPVDVSPAAFRKAVAFKMVELDAEPPEGLDTDTATVRSILRLRNLLPEEAALRVTVGPLDVSGWVPVMTNDSPWTRDGDALVLERTLAPGQVVPVPLTFRVPRDRVPYPPSVGYDVKYRDAWLAKESMRMESEDVAPLYPAACWKAVPGWHLVGPFPLGHIDTSHIPGDIAKANANFYTRFGPEDGFDADRVYGDGLKWYPCDPQARGLLNFNALMGTLDHTLGYALCGVYSPEPQLTHAIIYADNFAQVVVNGELVEEAQTFGAPGGFVYVPLRLNAGWNTVTAKLFNNRGDWFLRFLIADPRGDLRLADRPGE
ncbi:MAG: hypothetical protein GY851_11540 [bacterium]|nr:hypothetical protein [bacterium]